VGARAKSAALKRPETAKRNSVQSKAIRQAVEQSGKSTVRPYMLRHACGFVLANQEGTANDTRLALLIYTALSQRRLSAVRVR
jgi:hypothetical protein